MFRHISIFLPTWTSQWLFSLPGETFFWISLTLTFTSFSFQIKCFFLKGDFFHFPMERSSSLPQVILHCIAWFILFSLLTAVSYKKKKCIISLFVYLLIFLSSSFSQLQIGGNSMKDKDIMFFSTFTQIPRTVVTSQTIDDYLLNGWKHWAQY